MLIDYDPSSGMTMFQFMDLEEELAKLFDGLKVDVISRHGLSPHFRHSIMRSTQVLYEQLMIETSGKDEDLTTGE